MTSYKYPYKCDLIALLLSDVLFECDQFSSAFFVDLEECRGLKHPSQQSYGARRVTFFLHRSFTKPSKYYFVHQMQTGPLSICIRCEGAAVIFKEVGWDYAWRKDKWLFVSIHQTENKTTEEQLGQHVIKSLTPCITDRWLKGYANSICVPDVQSTYRNTLVTPHTYSSAKFWSIIIRNGVLWYLVRILPHSLSSSRLHPIQLFNSLSSVKLCPSVSLSGCIPTSMLSYHNIYWAMARQEDRSHSFDCVCSNKEERQSSPTAN